MEIHKELNSLSKEFNSNLLLRLVQTGGFIFFLDGYDEISISDRSEVTNDIQTFISKAGTNNYYILTSRPEDSLASFGDFQSFKIKPLRKKEAFELLKKYDGNKKKELSGKLIDLLNSGKYDSIDEYLENPLLVSLLYAAFDHKQTIPLKKHQFYRQVYNALYDAHKLAQGQNPHEKRSGLDIDDFNRVLRRVGFECLTRIGVRFDEDTILNCIRVSKESCGYLDFSESDFLKDLMTSVPLFCKDGIEYKWAHKSLMEYFAARFVAEDAKENQDKILEAIFGSEYISKYINMLDLYFDIDMKGFSKNITLPLCEKYIEFYEKNFIISKINKDLIEERISILFLTQLAFTIIPKFSEQEIGLTIKSKASLLFHKAKLGFDYDSTGFGWRYVKDEVIFYASAFNQNLKALMPLFDEKSLLNAKISFFIDLHNWRERGLPKELYELEREKVYIVNTRTGENSEETYRAINYIITPNSYVRLDYEACKKEIERIRKEITKSGNPNELLAGI